MVRIAVDAMGGDHAPATVVEGMLMATEAMPNEQFLLVGREPEIRAEFERQGADVSRFEIVHAEQVVAMQDSPVDALRKKPDSSICRIVSLLKERHCDAIFSAGNTGAMVAASQMLLGKLPNVRRAGIAITVPRSTTPVVLMDVGANVQCKPNHLFQYGVMACEIASRLYGIREPKVALLNVGSEEQKGNTLVLETRELFRNSALRYSGNVEGGDIFNGEADVIICDGFVGNIVLKVSEGLSEYLLRSLSSAFKELAGSEGSDAKSQPLREAFGSILGKFDYAEYGAAPLLGVDGVVMIGHGRSDGRAVLNACRWACKTVEARVNEHIVAAIEA